MLKITSVNAHIKCTLGSTWLACLCIHMHTNTHACMHGHTNTHTPASNTRQNKKEFKASFSSIEFEAMLVYSRPCLSYFIVWPAFRPLDPKECLLNGYGFLRQAFSVSLWPACNLLAPNSLRPACFCLPGAGLTGVGHQAPNPEA